MKGADSCGMATVLRRVREPRKKSDGLPSRGREQKRVGRSRSIARSPSGTVISLLSPIRPSGQYTERVLLPTLTENFVGCCTGRSAGLSPPRNGSQCRIGILCRFC